MKKLVLVILITIISGIISASAIADSSAGMQQTSTATVAPAAAATGAVETPQGMAVPQEGEMQGLPVTTNPAGPGFASQTKPVDILSLIKIEEDVVFYKRVDEESRGVNGLDTGMILRERKIYKEKIKKAQEGFDKCLVNKDLSDLDKSALLSYGMCRKMESGAAGCDDIKQYSPESCGVCQKQDLGIWGAIVKPVMEFSATSDAFDKISGDFCAGEIQDKGKMPKEMATWSKEKLMSVCKAQINDLLAAMRVVFFLKDRRECNTLPDGNQYKEYCFANFDRKIDYCDKFKDEKKPAVCLQDIYLSGMAVSLNDETLFPNKDGVPTVNAVLAKALMGKGSCEGFLKSARTKVCGVFMDKSKELAATEVDFKPAPPPAKDDKAKEEVKTEDKPKDDKDAGGAKAK